MITFRTAKGCVAFDAQEQTTMSLALTELGAALHHKQQKITELEGHIARLRAEVESLTHQRDDAQREANNLREQLREVTGNEFDTYSF